MSALQRGSCTVVFRGDERTVDYAVVMGEGDLAVDWVFAGLTSLQYFALRLSDDEAQAIEDQVLEHAARAQAGGPA